MRKYVGEVFTLKTSLEDLRGELIPSFGQVLESWVTGVRGTSYADPGYFFEVTYLTEPLRLFVNRIIDNLRSVGIVGGSLERGFGFGKTHSLILLWHLFTSDKYRESEIVSIPRDVVRETLVLGMDFSQEKPLTKLVSLLEAYSDMEHPVAKMREGRLVQAVRGVLSQYDKSRLYGLSADELAGLIEEILEKCSEYGCKRPRLLLLVDELGYGLAQRVRRYADLLVQGEEDKANEIYYEANSVINFLSYLYERLQGKPYSAIVVWVLAEQDRREINAIMLKHQDSKVIHSKIEGLLKDLDSLRERYSRGLAGTGISELSYSPSHAIEIATHRLLKSTVSNLSDVREAYYSNLKLIASQLNLREPLESFKGELEKFYPFSLGLIRLFRKVMNPRDLPGTEYVRTVLYIAAEAAEKALREDATGSYTISLTHLSLPEPLQATLTGELEGDWIQAASDVEMALEKIEEKYRYPAELSAKYIFAKGVTANVLALVESEDEREIERYGSTLEEIQVEIIQSHREAESFRFLELLGEALEKLKAESARIEERETKGKRYLLPSFFKTIYSKLTAFVQEERRNAEKETIIPLYLRQKGTVPSLFANVKVVLDGRAEDVAVSLIEFNKVWDTSVFTSHHAFVNAQREGKLLLSIVPVWDLDLYNRLYKEETGYDQLVEGLAGRLQAEVDKGKIQRPLHIVVLVPNLAKHRLDKLLDKLVVYEGTKRFLHYLERSSDILMERLREYEDTITKRRNLMEIYAKELKEKHLARLRSKLEREISDARRLAQRQLVSLSREIVAEILSLYSTAIYYSLDEGRFVSKTITPPTIGAPIEGLGGYEAPKNLERYTSILNGYLRSIINSLNYHYKPIEIMRVVLDRYRKEFESGSLRESDRIDEVMENLLQGSYDVKPLSATVAGEAIKYLHKQAIELTDKTIEIIVDEAKGLILFNTKHKETPEEEAPPTTTNAPPVSAHEFSTPAISGSTVEVKPKLAGETTKTSINLELPPGFGVDDIQQKLTVFIEHHKATVNELVFQLQTSKANLSFTIREIDIDSLRDWRVVLNLISRLSTKETSTVKVSITLGEPIKEQIVKEVFGDYYTVKRSFDRFLP